MARITAKEAPKKLTKKISIKRIMDLLQFVAICYLVLEQSKLLDKILLLF
jgi:hypothetical protein